MPTKRRASTSTEESAPSSTRKSKKGKSISYNQVAICQELFDTVRNYKTPDGRLLCESLIRAPKRRTTPEYYETVKNPIDLMKIQQKLKTDEYDEIDQMTEDLHLLIKNTKSFYSKSSQEYQDAVQIWTLFTSTKSDLISNAFGEKSAAQKTDTDPLVQAKCQQLLDAFQKLKNGDRLLCEVFIALPDRKELPIYYQTIKNPIDLDTITKKLHDGGYDGVGALEYDLNLMLKNAMEFNEPGSTIYKDAETLQLMMRAVMSDIMLASPGTSASKSDKRARRSSTAPPTDPMEEDTDTDNPEEDEDEDGDEDNSMLSLGDDVAATGDPYWLLFKAIATHTDSKGKIAAKPFLTLPNRRWFPDYYTDIANPISMTQIKRKIKKKKYNSLNEMAADMNLMFENAKEYNADESKIFQNAIEMQSVMWEKKKQIDGGIKFEVDSPPSTVSRRSGGSKAKGGKAAVKPGEGMPIAKSASPSRRAKSKARKSLVCDPSERTLKKRLMAIYNAVYDCEDNDGRSLIEPFIDLPSKDDYPEYYNYITEPIDMSMIEQKISTDRRRKGLKNLPRYESEKDLIVDLKLMFNNARSFNEDDSQIYKDAGTLEKAMKKKVMALSIADDPEEDVVKRTFATVNSPLNDKLNDLYETIKVYKDQHHRVLSSPFVRLPSKAEYAEYYEVIKKPIDLARIQQKIQSGAYDQLENILLDVTQMFENAMVFNEPESILYKDAAVLLNEFLKRHECLDDPSQYVVPDVGAQVQRMLHSLFYACINHSDEDGRCYADSINELDSQATNGLTFTNIGINLKNKKYKRLDKFQDDIFTLCENVRKISRSDSQAFEDSVEVQRVFLTTRDNICRNGEGAGFSSPAISYTSRHLTKSVEEVIAEKQATEKAEELDVNVEAPDCQGCEELVKEGNTYSVGGFVYLTNSGGALPRIVNIHKLWRDEKGDSWLNGGVFYRIPETVHSSARKFLQQEVFTADVKVNVPLTDVTGKCYVMYVKDYRCHEPQGFASADVYVCESKYCKATKSFRKVKSLTNIVKSSNPVTLVSRSLPVLLTRTSSPGTASEQIDRNPTPLPVNRPTGRERKSVTIEVGDGQPGCVYYEQFVAENGCTYKLGDFVYLSPSALAHQPGHMATGPPPIARIEKLYKDSRGWYVFVGPVFLRPEAIDHTPARLFYQREVFLSAAEEKTYNLASVVGKCCVLWTKDFTSYRPTEFSEDHIYVCEWKYMEGDGENSTRRLAKGLKSPNTSSQVCDDELCYFSKKISIKRMASPLLFKLCAESYIQDQDDDSREQSRTPLAPYDPGSVDTPRNVASPGVAEAVSKKLMQLVALEMKKKKHHVTSFQLFANEIRRGIQDDNPGATFGEVSQLIAAKWRSLPDERVQQYKDKALKLQNEAKAKEAAAERQAAIEAANRPPPQPTQFSKEMFQQTPPFSQPQPGAPPQGQHFAPQQPGHYQQHPGQQPVAPAGIMAGGQVPMQQAYPAPQRPMMMSQDGQQWQGMPAGGQMNHQQPMYNSQSPMPPHSAAMQQFQQSMAAGSPMHRPSPAQTPDGAMQQVQQPMQVFQMMPVNQPAQMVPQQGPVAAPPPQRPPSPKFVSVDAPVSKLAHSDVYLKYIGGLRGDNPVKISNWERELNAEMVQPPNPSQLPTHWLPNRPEVHGNALTALHSLRDLMVKDTLKLQRAYQL